VRQVSDEFLRTRRPVLSRVARHAQFARDVERQSLAEYLRRLKSCSAIAVQSQALHSHHARPRCSPFCRFPSARDVFAALSGLPFLLHAACRAPYGHLPTAWGARHLMSSMLTSQGACAHAFSGRFPLFNAVVRCSAFPLRDRRRHPAWLLERPKTCVGIGVFVLSHRAHWTCSRMCRPYGCGTFYFLDRGRSHRQPVVLWYQKPRHTVIC